ncbi:MAG: ferric reductase, partial [Pseudomonadota bacterium]
MTRPRTILIWGALGLAMAVPLVVSLMSPLLAWREPVYIAAGAAGVVGLALLLVQPLLAAGLLPG